MVSIRMAVSRCASRHHSPRISMEVEMVREDMGIKATSLRTASSLSMEASSLSMEVSSMVVGSSSMRRRRVEVRRLRMLCRSDGEGGNGGEKGWKGYV